MTDTRFATARCWRSGTSWRRSRAVEGSRIIEEGKR
jgi:hypothetical protein